MFSLVLVSNFKDSFNTVIFPETVAWKLHLEDVYIYLNRNVDSLLIRVLPL